jgi:hypothetical protein
MQTTVDHITITTMEDHEYVVLLYLEWIFTELLTEMWKPEVEKKSNDRKFNKWALFLK